MGLQDIVWLFVVVLGLRLAVQGFRLHSAESALGVALVLMGLGGAAVRLALDSSDLQVAIPGLVLIHAGTAMMAVFTARTFHPGSNAARAGIAACVVILGLGLWHQLAFSGMGSGAMRQSPVMALARAAVLAWPAVAAAWFRRMYVRRAALGLADPVVSNRFLLFATWNTTLALMPLFTLAVGALAGDEGEWRRLVLVPARIMGLVTLVGIWLTFLPPEAYLRRVRGGSSADDANTGATP